MFTPAVIFMSLFVVWLILTFLPIWGVRFRLFYKNLETGKMEFEKWTLAEKTSFMSYWKIRRGEVNVKGTCPQKILDVFRNCGNMQFKVGLVFLPF